MSFGNYEDQEINRHEETELIRNNPVIGSGNAGGSANVITDLRARFAKRDVQKTSKIKLIDKTGQPLWVEMDLDYSEADAKARMDAAKIGNRNQRRGDNTNSNLSEARAHAWLLNEKCVAIYLDDPEKGGEKFLDSEGSPMTFHSIEWLEALDVDPNHPLDGVLELISFPALLVFWQDYLAEINDLVSGADFTPVSSGD